MSETGKAPEPASDLSGLPRHTTPTWEVELLISGVAVFAMLQLPGWLDDQYYALVPRIDMDWLSFVTNAYAYLKTVSLILSMTFSLHLLLRAQWIALVGMYSVHPAGILWDRLRLGPLQRKAEQARFGDRDVVIDRADNRATTVFAIGVMLASVLLLVILGSAIVFAVAMIVVRVFALPVDVNAVFAAGAVLVLAPMMVARWIDRSHCDGLREGGLVRRTIEAIFRFYTAIGLLGRGSNPTLALLASHGGERRAIGTVMLLVMLAFASVGLGHFAMKDPDRFGSYALFPRDEQGVYTVDAAHYADQRDVARDDAVPMLQSAVIVGPFARLVVPYEPVRDGMRLKTHCAGMTATDPNTRDTALRKCLQGQRAVTLDGKPLPSEAYELGSDAVTNRPALVMMIDVRDLSHGRHELQVARAQRDGDRADDDDEGRTRSDRIAFWR